MAEERADAAERYRRAALEAVSKYEAAMVQWGSGFVAGGELPMAVAERLERSMRGVGSASGAESEFKREAASSWDMMTVRLPHNESLEKLPQPPSADDEYQKSFLAAWLSKRSAHTRQQPALESPRSAHMSIRVPVLPRQVIPLELGTHAAAAAVVHARRMEGRWCASASCSGWGGWLVRYASQRPSATVALPCRCPRHATPRMDHCGLVTLNLAVDLSEPLALATQTPCFRSACGLCPCCWRAGGERTTTSPRAPNVRLAAGEGADVRPLARSPRLHRTPRPVPKSAPHALTGTDVWSEVEFSHATGDIGVGSSSRLKARNSLGGRPQRLPAMASARAGLLTPPETECLSAAISITTPHSAR